MIDSLCVVLTMSEGVRNNVEHSLREINFFLKEFLPLESLKEDMFTFFLNTTAIPGGNAAFLSEYQHLKPPLFICFKSL